MKRINLIPREAKRIPAKKWIKIEVFKSRASRIITGIVLVVVFVSLWQATGIFRYKWANTRAEKRISQMQAQLTILQAQQEQIRKEREALDKEKKQAASRMKTLQEAKEEAVDWSSILAHLSSLVPQKLWVTRASLNRNLVTINGTTFDNTLVSRFMLRLDESKTFEDTSFNYTQKGKLDDTGVINFEVTTHLAE